MGVHEFLNATGFIKNKGITFLSYLLPIAIPFVPVQMASRYLPFVATIYVFGLFAVLLKTHSNTKVETVGLTFLVSIGLPYALSTIIYIRDTTTPLTGMFYLMLALIGAWGSDTGAYFAGVFLGKHKLAPTISPKKTIEGLIGGLATCTVLSIINGIIFVNIGFNMGYTVQVNYMVLALAAPIVSLVSVLGDLSASILKRQHGIKDFGNIMPGHGGILDRFDSVFFVAPLIYIVHEFIPLITIS